MPGFRFADIQMARWQLSFALQFQGVSVNMVKCIRGTSPEAERSAECLVNLNYSLSYGVICGLTSASDLTSGKEVIQDRAGDN